MNIQNAGVTALIERPESERPSQLAKTRGSTLTLFLLTAIYGGWRRVRSDVYARDEDDARQKARVWMKTHEQQSGAPVLLSAHPQRYYDAVHQRWWPGMIQRIIG